MQLSYNLNGPLKNSSSTARKWIIYSAFILLVCHAYTSVALLYSTFPSNIQCTYKTSHDKMSQGQNVTGTKCPWDKMDKTSQGKNVPRDKMSQGTKRPREKNVPRDKTSQRHNVPRDQTSQVTKHPKGTNEAHYLIWCDQLPNPIRSR